MKVRVQDLYDLAVAGKKVHRGTLKDTAYSMLTMRYYTRLDNITLTYTDIDGNETEVSAADDSMPTTRMKILVLFAVSQHDNYSRSSREELKRKLGLDKLNCNYYMPEIIDGRTREWTVDNLEDAIAALRKDK